MDKHISIKFKSTDFEQNSELFKFSGVASRSGVMTTHAIIFAEGAFKKALKKLKTDGKNILPMLFNHNENVILGGFPVSQIKEKKDELLVTGEINLNVERGREIAALMKQGVIDSMSVSVDLDPKTVTFDEKLNALLVGSVSRLFEITLCINGANPDAKVTSFTAVPFSDLPIAQDNFEWHEAEALERVKKFTNSENSPSDSYKHAFFWYDKENSDNFSAYKYLFADVINYELKTVPRAISAIIRELKNTDIPHVDRHMFKRNINRYLIKMGYEKEFTSELFTVRECENFLRVQGLTQNEAKQFISIIKTPTRDVVESVNEDAIRDVLSTLNKSNTLSEVANVLRNRT